jgi:hypothetical protein
MPSLISYYNISATYFQYVWEIYTYIHRTLRDGRQRNRSSSPGRVKNFFLSNCSMAHPSSSSYPMGTGGSFPGDNAAEA